MFTRGQRIEKIGIRKYRRNEKEVKQNISSPPKTVGKIEKCIPRKGINGLIGNGKEK